MLTGGELAVDLDQPVRLREPGHLDEGVRGIGLGEELGAQRDDLVEMGVHVGDHDRHLGDVSEARAGPAEHGRQVRERAPRLGVEVRPRRPAVLVDARLPGDKEQVPNLDRQ